MKRFLSGVLLLLFGIPAFALADNGIPLGPTPAQMLTTVASIEAQEAAITNNESLACIALFSRSTVSVGQQVILAWGSTGAVEQTKDSLNEWPLDGAFTMSFSQTGTLVYPFTFYDPEGNSVTCKASIVVTK
jgi:hypothetical protein